MKTLLHVVLFCLMFSWVDAQPTLSSSEMAPFGTTYGLKAIQDFSVIDTTIQGADTTWNFSTLQNNTSIQDLNITIVDPSQTPYGSSFPTANYGYLESPDTAYRYFYMDASKKERVGSWSGGILKTYNDPQVEYVFPLSLGVSNSDTWDNDQSSFGGTYDLECVGYGTLILPDVTYNDVLMVRVFVEEWFLAFYAYYWYSSDNGIILLYYIVGDGFFVADKGGYIGTSSTGIKGENFVYDLRYNNPINNSLNLSIQSKEASIIEYSVVNVLGKIILSGNASVSPQNVNLLNLDFSGLKSGIYFLSIKSDKSNQKTRSIKLIKM